MSNTAFLMMLITETLITGFTIRFFWKVLKSKHNLNAGIKDP